jgi:hypothetical protein
VSLETAVLFLAQQARLILLPMSLQKVKELQQNLVYSLESQRDLVEFIFNEGDGLKRRGANASEHSLASDDDDEDDLSMKSENQACISWKIVLGPKNLGKSTRVLSACEAVSQSAELLFEVSRLAEHGYDQDLYSSFTKNIRVPRSKEIVWIDLRGIVSKASFISGVACQIGLQEESLSDLERATEIFFLNIQPGSVIIFDHVSYPYGISVLKEYFGYLATYPIVDSKCILTETESEFSASGPAGKTNFFSSKWKVSLVVLTREVEHIESDLQSMWNTIIDTRPQFPTLMKHPLQSVRIHFLPLPSREEIVALSSKFSSHFVPVAEDIDTVLKVFAGVSGNLAQMLALGDVAVAAALPFVSSAQSPFDIDAVVADAKLSSALNPSLPGQVFSTSQNTGRDCQLIIDALLPLNISTYIVLNQLENAESTITLFDTDYIVPPFHKNLAWELSRDKFQSDDLKPENQQYSERFEAAWRILCKVGWISLHWSMGSSELYYLEHPTRLPIFGVQVSDGLQSRDNYFSIPMTDAVTEYIKPHVEKYLLIVAAALVDLNARLKYLSYFQSADLSSESKFASCQYSKQKLSGYCYDIVVPHLNILFLAAQFRFSSSNQHVDSSPQSIEGDEGSIGVRKALMDPLSYLERYYKSSCIDLYQISITDHCGIFPCGPRVEFDDVCFTHFRSLISSLNFSNIIPIIAGNIEILIRFRLPPVHAVSLCKINLESCISIRPLASMEANKIGKKLLVVGRNPQSVKIPSHQYVLMLLEMSGLFVDRKRFSKAKELLRLATEISQELEEGESGESGEGATVLVKSLLSYAWCIERDACDGAEGREYDECEFDDEEAIFGIWTESVALSSSIIEDKSTKYYADGDCLRTVKYGHSKSSVPSAFEQKTQRLKEREKARPLYEQALFALEILNQVNGSLKEEAALIYIRVLSRLGDLERALGNIKKSKQYVEDSVRWRKRYFGNYSLLVAEGFQQLGYLLQTMYKPQAAIQVYAIAVTIFAAIQKEASFRLIASLSSVTACLRCLGRETETKRYLREIHSLSRNVFHIFDSPAINAMVRFACTLSSYEPKAFIIPGDCSIISSFGSRNFPLSLRPYDIVGVEYFCGSRLSKTLNESHLTSSINIIDVAISLVKYNINTYTNRYIFGETVNPVLAKVMDVISRRKVESNEPLRLANILIVQASLQSLRGSYDDSITSLDEAIKLFQYQNTDPDTRSADVLLAKGEMNRRAALISICGGSLAHSHTLTRYDCKDYGNSFAEMDRLRRMKNTLENFKDSLIIYRTIYGSDHPIVLSIMRYLANTYRDLGAVKTAKANFEVIMDTYHGIKVGPTIEYADALFSYAIMMRSSDEHEASVTVLEQCLSIYRKIYGENSLPAVITTFVLASSLLESDDMDPAATLLDDCLENFRKLYGDSALSSKTALVEPPVIGDILNYVASIKQVQLEI